MLIAAGATLADLGLTQDSVQPRGFALQCRITTEDPANGFRPDTGKITTYRSPGGPGVRLDGGTTYSGAEISPHFDSMLAKLTCRGRTFESAVQKARRALLEFRIRGVSTNVGFLQAVLADPDFAAGGVTTSFIEDHPQLLTRAGRRRPRHAPARATSPTSPSTSRTAPRRSSVSPASKLPRLDRSQPVPDGTRQLLREVGPEEFARRLRAQDRVAVTDTTFRDAHQSLLATRVRTRDLLAVADHVARTTPELWSVECWGGATYDVALRFLAEDPWERLAALREAIPNIGLQMLLRGRNTVGYTPYPTEVTEAFVQEAAETGIDVFRVFDALNDVSQMRPAIDAVRATGTSVAEVALCYTGDLSSPGEKLYTLDYYLRLAEQIVDAGAHVLAIKDMAGLLRAPAARTLVTALRERFDLPVHLHTHDTPGGQLATLVAAIDAGVDAVDAACAAMAGTTSQPALSALVSATDHSERETGLSLAAVNALEPYWEATRRVYAPFESGLPAPTGRVYRHEIPGGQLSNLRQQAIALGLGEKFEQVEDMYAAANDILGNVVKVTPSSKVVGDLALALVAAGADPARVRGRPGVVRHPGLGDRLPQRRARRPARRLARAVPHQGAGRAHLEAADREPHGRAAGGPRLRPARRRSTSCCSPARPRRSSSRASSTATCPCCRPSTTSTACAAAASTPSQLREGKQVLYGLEAISEPDERGLRNVMATIDGQLRPVSVRDRSVSAEVVSAEKADLEGPRPGRGAVRRCGDRRPSPRATRSRPGRRSRPSRR